MAVQNIENLPFPRKYRPTTLKGYIGNEKLKETVMRSLSSGKRPQVILMTGNSGCGKAQPLDSLVLTTSGYKRMGDIKVGDEVFTHNSNKGKVSGVFPQGVRPIYRITLSDRTYIDVSDEHLNCVWSVVDDAMLVLTTKELLKRIACEEFYIIRSASNEVKSFNTYSEEYKFSTEVLIKTVERIEDQECQCIMVDHPDHTYISDFFIPTHNTTMARLLAKEYSCYDRDEETGACGVCSSCTAIDEYITTGATDMLMNIKEVNVSDQSGKNDLNDILEDMQIPSFGDEWKVYIFDECHKASEGLQNLLLKPIEEPPEHVLMIFCTTNPEKLIPTFLNRCQLTLEVTKPSIKELAGLLRYVCTNEGVEYDKDGLEFIAKRSEFTIRTALQNLQQVVNEQNSAKFEKVTQVFEQVSNTLIIDFFKALKNRDTLRYVTLLTQIKSKMDLSVFLNELKGFVKRGIYVINGIDQDDITDLEIPIYRQLFSDLGLSEIATLLNKILTFHSNNLELELLMWGYTGLVSETGTSDKQEITKPKDEEINQEVAEALKNIKEKEEVSYEEGVANAERLNKDITIEDILSMGGSLVE